METLTLFMLVFASAVLISPVQAVENDDLHAKVSVDLAVKNLKERDKLNSLKEFPDQQDIMEVISGFSEECQSNLQSNFNLFQKKYLAKSRKERNAEILTQANITNGTKGTQNVRPASSWNSTIDDEMKPTNFSLNEEESSKGNRSINAPTDLLSVKDIEDYYLRKKEMKVPGSYVLHRKDKTSISNISKSATDVSRLDDENVTVDVNSSSQSFPSLNRTNGNDIMRPNAPLYQEESLINNETIFQGDLFSLPNVAANYSKRKEINSASTSFTYPEKNVSQFNESNVTRDVTESSDGHVTKSTKILPALNFNAEVFTEGASTAALSQTSKSNESEISFYVLSQRGIVAIHSGETEINIAVSPLLNSNQNISFSNESNTGNETIYINDGNITIDGHHSSEPFPSITNNAEVLTGVNSSVTLSQTSKNDQPVISLFVLSQHGIDAIHSIEKEMNITGSHHLNNNQNISFPNESKITNETIQVNDGTITIDGNRNSKPFPSINNTNGDDIMRPNAPLYQEESLINNETIFQGDLFSLPNVAANYSKRKEINSASTSFTYPEKKVSLFNESNVTHDMTESSDGHANKSIKILPDFNFNAEVLTEATAAASLPQTSKNNPPEISFYVLSQRSVDAIHSREKEMNITGSPLLNNNQNISFPNESDIANETIYINDGNITIDGHRSNGPFSSITNTNVDDIMRPNVSLYQEERPRDNGRIFQGNLFRLSNNAAFYSKGEKIHFTGIDGYSRRDHDSLDQIQTSVRNRSENPEVELLTPDLTTTYSELKIVNVTRPFFAYQEQIRSTFNDSEINSGVPQLHFGDVAVDADGSIYIFPSFRRYAEDHKGANTSDGQEDRRTSRRKQPVISLEDFLISLLDFLHTIVGDYSNKTFPSPNHTIDVTSEETHDTPHSNSDFLKNKSRKSGMTILRSPSSNDLPSKERNEHFRLLNHISTISRGERKPAKTFRRFVFHPIFRAFSLWNKSIMEDIRSANGFVDEILERVRKNESIVSQIDPVSLPDSGNGFVILNHVYIKGLSNLYRSQDTIILSKISRGEKVVHVVSEIEVKNVTIHLNYSSKEMSVWHVWEGTIEVQDLTIEMNVSVTNFATELVAFEIAHLWSYRIDTAKNDAPNWLKQNALDDIQESLEGLFLELLEGKLADAVRFIVRAPSFDRPIV